MNALKISFYKIILITGASLLAFQAFADGTAVPGGTDVGATPQAPGMGSMLVPFVLMFAVMYFLMIRPQQKRMKEQQSMLGALKDGDEVLTASGIMGTVRGINDKLVTLEIDRNVQVKMLKSQVSQVVKGPLPEQLAP
jgi:preprotein translocase subunit YajC